MTMEIFVPIQVIPNAILCKKHDHYKESFLRGSAFQDLCTKRQQVESTKFEIMPKNMSIIRRKTKMRNLIILTCSKGKQEPRTVKH